MTNLTDNKPSTPSATGPRTMRLRALAVLVFVAGLLGTAVYLDPARLEHPFQTGYRFLSPCGFLYRTGYPCPTCYMTRSFAYLMHGRPDKAFAAQPFGALLCLMVIYLGWGAVQVLYTNRPWRPVWSAWSKKWLLAILLAAFLSGWLFRLAYGTFISHEFPLHH
jgi:hypothetical protein